MAPTPKPFGTADSVGTRLPSPAASCSSPPSRSKPLLRNGRKRRLYKTSSAGGLVVHSTPGDYRPVSKAQGTEEILALRPGLIDFLSSSGGGAGHELVAILEQWGNLKRSVSALGPAIAALETPTSARLASAIQATENLWTAIEDRWGLLRSSEVATLLGSRSGTRNLASSLRQKMRLSVSSAATPSFIQDFSLIARQQLFAKSSPRYWLPPAAQASTTNTWCTGSAPPRHILMTISPSCTFPPIRILWKNLSRAKPSRGS